MTREKWVVCFQGHVQGVGFRYHVLRLARRRPLTGYVCNLPDGRVELVVEGDALELRQFLDEIKATTPGRIASTSVLRGAADGSMNGFEIRASPPYG